MLLQRKLMDRKLSDRRENKRVHLRLGNLRGNLWRRRMRIPMQCHFVLEISERHCLTDTWKAGKLTVLGARGVKRYVPRGPHPCHAGVEVQGHQQDQLMQTLFVFKNALVFIDSKTARCNWLKSGHHPISELVSIPVVEAAKFPSLLSLTARRKSRKGKLNQSETFLEIKKIPISTEE